MQRLRSLAAFVAAGALVCCASAAGGWHAAPAGGTLRIVDARDVDSLDPALAYEALSWQLLLASCEPLMGITDTASKRRVVPRGAAGFPVVSRDGLTYRFRIRRDPRFSDGSRVTAARYAAGLGRVVNPRMRSPTAGLLKDVTSVSAHGRTLVIRLEQPNTDIVTRLSLPVACPVPIGTPVDPAGVDLPVGSGPYVVATHERSRRIVLERNRWYRGASPSRPARIVVTITGNRETLVDEVEAGRADYLVGVPPDRTAALLRKYPPPSRRLLRVPGGQTAFLALNTSRPLFRRNVALRRAVNFALDRPEILRQTGNPLFWKRTDQLLHPGYPGFVDADLYPLKRPNVRFARRLARGHLRDATAVLYTRPTPFWLRQAEVIRHNLAEIGVRLEVRSFALAVLAERVGRRGEPFDLVAAYWITDFPDPSDILMTFLSARNASAATGNSNWSYFQNAAFDRRLAAAARLSGQERYRAFSRFERDVLREQAPVAPLFYSISYSFFGPRMGCVTSAAQWELGSLCVGR